MVPQPVDVHLLNPDGVKPTTAGMEKLPAVYVIDEHMTQESLRSLYAAVDCFVLPSRCAAVPYLNILGQMVLECFSLPVIVSHKL